MILEEFPNLPNAKWVALRLLEGDQSIIESIRNGELGNLKKQELVQLSTG
jgi:ferrous iron transport protein B